MSASLVGSEMCIRDRPLAVRSGMLSLRSSAGQQFQAALQKDAELMSAYRDLGKTYSAQREFRLRWAEQEVERLRQSRVVKETSKQSFG
eukprot:8001875-Alexandrium_andersonii.AAC.1